MTGSAATWILQLAEGTGGLRVAIKDLIDVAGVPTTAGSRAVASTAVPAATDATCLAGIRADVSSGRARLVGKANLHELADGITGMNPWFGTPVNPLDPTRVPGGSSSGSAVAVGRDDADVALGTDTGGSVRIPAACCGVAGMKTSAGRVPLGGVWPLAASLDTVGPIARDMAGIVDGLRFLLPGFTPAGRFAGPVGRVRPAGLDVHPLVDAAVDRLLAVAGVEVLEVDLPGWLDASRYGLQVLGAEAFAAHGQLVRGAPGTVGADVVAGFALGARVGRQQLRQARAACATWARRMGGVFDRVAVLALPTIGSFAPAVGPHAGAAMTVAWTLPVNVAGLPALALPIPPAWPASARVRLPASLQLVGPPAGEELLCAAGRLYQAAAGADLR